MVAADRPSASPTSNGPVRTCVGCRKRAGQSDLVRVVVRTGRADGPVTADTSDIAWLDLERSGHGRGAYLHPSLSCLDLAERRRGLARALRRPGSLDTAALRERMAALWPET